MRVLMLGWEFPPHMSGGLGTACAGMTRALARKGTEILFVLPRAAGDGRTDEALLRLRSASGTRLSGRNVVREQFFETVRERSAEQLLETTRRWWEEHIAIREVDSLLFPYADPESYEDLLRETVPYEATEGRTVAVRRRDLLRRAETVAESGEGPVVRLHGGYGADLFSEVFRYSQAVAVIAEQERFDVIHAHDWMTYPAGMLAARLTGKPLVAHIHATEADRSGKDMDSRVAHIEWAGLTAADRVVAVSHYTKALIGRVYQVPEERIDVVHNAVSRTEARRIYRVSPRCRHEKRVLFMGRITFQKGPDYFVEAARLVLEKLPETRFIMAGSGDMLPRMVRRVARLRMGGRFHFTGFLRGDDVDRMYAVSDLYVMPSVSEPFGIAPLEAMAYDVPVLMSRQSGVSEVIRHALKADFWDVRDMADKICAVLSYPKLAAEMVANCREELKTIRWENAADRLNAVYARVCGL